MSSSSDPSPIVARRGRLRERARWLSLADRTTSSGETGAARQDSPIRGFLHAERRPLRQAGWWTLVRVAAATVGPLAFGQLATAAYGLGAAASTSGAIEVCGAFGAFAGSHMLESLAGSKAAIHTMKIGERFSHNFLRRLARAEFRIGRNRRLPDGSKAEDATSLWSYVHSVADTITTNARMFITNALMIGGTLLLPFGQLALGEVAGAAGMSAMLLPVLAANGYSIARSGRRLKGTTHRRQVAQAAANHLDVVRESILDDRHREMLSRGRGEATHLASVDEALRKFYAPAYREVRKYTLATSNLQRWSTVAGAIGAFAIWFGATMLGFPIPPGALIAALTANVAISTPVQNLTSFLAGTKQGITNARELDRTIEKTETKDETRTEDRLASALQGRLVRVELHEVSHSESGLSDITLTIDMEKPGFVVVTGPSGTGKSTLLELIMGYQRPSTGKIVYIDSTGRHLDHTEVDFTSVRERLGYQPQSTPVVKPANFGHTNIVIHDPTDPDAPALKPSASDLAPAPLVTYRQHLALFHQGMTDQELARRFWVRPLDGSAANPSGGERSILGLASLPDGKPILVDEPESGVDPANTDRVFLALRERAKRQKVLVVVQKIPPRHLEEAVRFDLEQTMVEHAFHETADGTDPTTHVQLVTHSPPPVVRSFMERRAEADVLRHHGHDAWVGRQNWDHRSTAAKLSLLGQYGLRVVDVPEDSALDQRFRAPLYDLPVLPVDDLADALNRRSDRLRAFTAERHRSTPVSGNGGANEPMIVVDHHRETEEWEREARDCRQTAFELQESALAAMQLRRDVLYAFPDTVEALAIPEVQRAFTSHFGRPLRPSDFGPAREASDLDESAGRSRREPAAITL